MSDIHRVESITFNCKECNFFEKETHRTGHSKRQEAFEHAKETGHEIDSYCNIALYPYDNTLERYPDGNDSISAQVT